MEFFNRLKQLRFFKYLFEFLILIFRLIFSVSLFTFIAYFVLEYLKIGLISNYFDINLLLVVAIICGFILIIFDETEEIPNFNKGKILLLAIISLIAGLLSFQYLQNFEKMRYFIPLLVIFTIFISIYLYQNKDYE